MAEIINLRSARKQRERAAAAAQAAENRARHGRTKAEALRDKRDAERAAKALDDAKQEK